MVTWESVGRTGTEPGWSMRWPHSTRPRALRGFISTSCVLILLARAAHAVEEPGPESPSVSGGPFLTEARGRLELRTSMALRNDRVSTDDYRIHAHGQALSQLGLDGLWLVESAPVGVAARIEVQRFSLRGEDRMSGRLDSIATALEASSALAFRVLAVQRRLSLEGHLGYAYGRTPLTQVRSSAGAGEMAVAVTTIGAHGPALAARLAFAASEMVGLEASARARPITFGARHAGGPLSLRSLSAGAAVSVGRFSGRGLHLSGLLGYELGTLQAEGDAAGGSGRLVIRQLQHAIGVGLRAAFALPPAPVAIAAAPAPPVAPPPAPAPVGVVRGVVRSTHSSQAGPAGAGLAGVKVVVPGRPAVTTDAQGSFVLEGLEPGLVTLRIEGPDLMPEDEVLSVPPEGEVSVELLIRPIESARLAAIIGLVRSEEGAPLTARVSIPELGLEAQADGKGQFRIEVPAGRYTLVIEAPGLVVQRKPVTVGAGEHSIHNVDLQRER